MVSEPIFNRLPKPRPISLAGRRVLVLGAGDTGLSVARWVAHEGGLPRVADTRAAPPRAGALQAAVPRAEVRCGAFEPSLLQGVELVCLSPGLALAEPLVQEAAARGIPIVGDIELFAWRVRQDTGSRVLAITGTNGKTTATAMTGHLLRTAGVDCEVAGNIGPAALDALITRLDSHGLPAVWVLELSSYQLETTWTLEPDVAAMLNLTEDHLDRYADLDDYGAAKARIFLGSGTQILNRDDPRSAAMAMAGRMQTTFGLNVPPGSEDFGVVEDRGVRLLAQGANRFMRTDALGVHGLHNVANALAAVALCRGVGVLPAACVSGLSSFRGLPHRLELVATRSGVDWYDDSKGTNVGATIAALNGLARPAVLILGGDGKGQDFRPLAPAVEAWARTVLLIGRDAGRIEEALAGTRVALRYCKSLEQAVGIAASTALPGDAVLLSPACASFDMFRDYKHRGDVFAAAARALGA